MRVMTEHLSRRPSEAELLAADYPHAEIYREVLDGGRHGDWTAEVQLRLRGATPAALRVLLIQIGQLTRRGSRESDAGRTGGSQ